MLLFAGFSQEAVLIPGYWPSTVTACGYWYYHHLQQLLQQPGNSIRAKRSTMTGSIAAFSASNDLKSIPRSSSANCAAYTGPSACPALLRQAWAENALPVLCVDFGSMGFLGLLPGPLFMLTVILKAVKKLKW
jgi:hypothetical protein